MELKQLTSEDKYRLLLYQAAKASLKGPLVASISQSELQATAVELMCKLRMFTHESDYIRLEEEFQHGFTLYMEKLFKRCENKEDKDI